MEIPNGFQEKWARASELCQFVGQLSHALIEAVEPCCKNAQGKLAPLTFAIKDSFEQLGHPTSFGLRPPLLDRAAEGAKILRRLEVLGATLLGIANLDEAALGALGRNQYFGDIPNPRHPECVAGGSSGGSAAGVALGCVDFAVGTDWGGSVRIPAAACGVFGFKASSKGLPRDGALLYHETQDSLGLLFDDIDIGFRVWDAIAETDVRVLDTYPVLCLGESNLSGIDPAVTTRYVAALKELSSKIELRESGDPIPFEEARDFRRAGAAAAVQKFFSRFDRAAETLPDQVRALLKKKQDEAPGVLESQFKNVFASWPGLEVLVTPCFAGTFPALRDDPDAVEKGAASTYFFELANVLDCPACVIPARYYGIPLQVIGPRGGDGVVWEVVRRIVGNA